jgi:tRNA-2-methylthio-N6-dimethylallyladenosine synthase
MNRHDSEKMAGVMAAEDYIPAKNMEEADLILLNTCSIREKAETKVFSQLGQLRLLKAKNPQLLLALAGCIAQQEGERLLQRFPYLDIVLGTARMDVLPALARRARRENQRLVEVSMPEHPGITNAQGALRESRLQAWVSIMEGCNNFCSYCVVPYVRGPERSRSCADIVEEIRALVARGTKEVTLLGQNVNSFGQNTGESFPRLLHLINEIDGLERLRFTTSHPKDLSPELITVMNELPQVMEHIHLPAQSGSTKILALMNRGYTGEGYLDKIKRLRDKIPHIAITTDIIVGFPGEKEEDHEDTITLLKAVEFDNIFSFKYSPRPQTKASRIPDDVPSTVKSRRLDEVIETQRAINLKKNQSLVGKKQEVLVEGPTPKKNRSWLTGRTRGNKVVHFPGTEDLAGKTVTITITHAYPFHLQGEI